MNRCRCLGIQPIPCHPGTDLRIAFVQFPVGDVVEQGGQFHDHQVGLLRLPDALRHSPDPINVPPVVPGAVQRQHLPDVVRRAVNEVEWGHHGRFQGQENTILPVYLARVWDKASPAIARYRERSRQSSVNGQEWQEEGSDGNSHNEQWNTPC